MSTTPTAPDLLPNQFNEWAKQYDLPIQLRGVALAAFMAGRATPAPQAASADLRALLIEARGSVYAEFCTYTDASWGAIDAKRRGDLLDRIDAALAATPDAISATDSRPSVATTLLKRYLRKLLDAVWKARGAYDDDEFMRDITGAALQVLHELAESEDAEKADGQEP